MTLAWERRQTEMYVPAEEHAATVVVGQSVMAGPTQRWKYLIRPHAAELGGGLDDGYSGFDVTIKVVGLPTVEDAQVLCEAIAKAAEGNARAL